MADETLSGIAHEAWNDSHEWFPRIHVQSHRHLLQHLVLGLTGEAGEVANVVKKANRDEAYPDSSVLGPELADVLVYLLHVATLSGIDLAAEYRAKRQINMGRWGAPTWQVARDA